MKSADPFDFRMLQVRRNALLCLLLATTFVFNPFFVASASHGFPSFNHLPSYRANVASSELLKFRSEVEVAAILDVASEVLNFVVAPVVQKQAVPRVRPIDEVVIPQVLSIGNIWFRPPPIA